jgi:putative Mg2+ transporter-C (MgtC) family protein
VPPPNALVIMARLAYALVLGVAIGLERERSERAAGMRTVTMVSLGSCLFTLLSLYGFGAFVPGTPTNLRADPSRVAAQIVTGIGFLGAGTIFMRRDLVRGLTTAATIWAVAAVGMAAAAGQYFAALFATLLILIVLMVFKPLERRLFKHGEEARISMVIPRATGGFERITRDLQAIGDIGTTIEVHEVAPDHDRLTVELSLPASYSLADLLHRVRAIEGVSQVSISQELREDRARLTT